MIFFLNLLMYAYCLRMFLRMCETINIYDTGEHVDVLKRFPWFYCVIVVIDCLFWFIRDGIHLWWQLKMIISNQKVIRIVYDKAPVIPVEESDYRDMIESANGIICNVDSGNYSHQNNDWLHAAETWHKAFALYINRIHHQKYPK